MSRIAAVVLAAGRSSRMGGRNKLLAEFDGRPLLHRALAAAHGSSAADVVVVTGHQADAVAAAVRDYLEGAGSVPAPRTIRIVHNPAFADGMATSLQRGLEAVAPDADAAVVLLGDMPQVTGRLVDALASAFAAAPDVAAVVPVVGGRRGNPVLLARRLFPEISALAGDEGARRLLAARPDVLEIPVDDAGAALDIDTPEALENARSRA